VALTLTCISARDARLYLKLRTWKVLHSSSHADRLIAHRIVGLVHGHVEGLLGRPLNGTICKSSASASPTVPCFDRLATRIQSRSVAYYASIRRHARGDQAGGCQRNVLIKDHRLAVEACAPCGVHLFLEKRWPSATRARRIDQLAGAWCLVLTNFETSWYALRFVRPNGWLTRVRWRQSAKWSSATA